MGGIIFYPADRWDFAVPHLGADCLPFRLVAHAALARGQYRGAGICRAQQCDWLCGMVAGDSFGRVPTANVLNALVPNCVIPKAMKRVL